MQTPYAVQVMTFEVIAQTDDVAVAAFRHKHLAVYGFQYHPEVYHSTDGKKCWPILSIIFVVAVAIGHLRHS